MQHIKITKMIDGLRLQFKKSFQVNDDGRGHVLDTASMRKLIMLMFVFSSIASIAIINFLSYAGLANDLAHALFSFVIANALILSFMIIKVLGFGGLMRAIKNKHNIN
ncbi:hypothetical protein [Pseudomonas sp. HY7a-MNA-CIBAN-0227]|uniref:hypothetical protein n=1 Tax=Pseudomonas sp. HY7a-MNA-CIBAN-0227 TaxID=3140474 RepID=UPI003319D69E